MPVYKDNAANRKLDRVGKTYGYKATGGVAPKAKAAPSAKVKYMLSIAQIKDFPAAKVERIKDLHRRALRFVSWQIHADPSGDYNISIVNDDWKKWWRAHSWGGLPKIKKSDVGIALSKKDLASMKKAGVRTNLEDYGKK